MDLPAPLRPLVDAFADIFTRPTFRRIVELMLCALLTVGRKTIVRMWAGGSLLGLGHVSDYHRIFSRASWSGLAAGRVLAGLVLTLLPADAQVMVAIDDTVTERPGDRVYGKGRHRDAKRSSHAHTQFLYGHKWVVASIVVQLPWLQRPVALPVLSALYRESAANAAQGLRHKTPSEIGRQLARVLAGWFPHRQFLIVGDDAFSTFDMARDAAASHGQMHLVGRGHSDMALFLPPAPRPPGRPGAPAIRGERLPTPAQALVHATYRWASVAWYGGGQRLVRFASGTGHWYRKGSGALVLVRWIHVEDMQGTHRDEWLYTTDVYADPAEVISTYTARWAIETLFQETRAHLGLDDTRNWCRASVSRLVPCIFGFASLLVLANHAAPPHERAAPQPLPWYRKAATTFSDIIAAARRWTWDRLIRSRAHTPPARNQSPPGILEFLLRSLCRAA